MKKPVAAVSQEEAIHLFRDMVKPSLDALPGKVDRILEDFVKFYQETRVEGADLDADGDMLLLEWGSNCPHLIKKFVDFRENGGDEVDFAEDEFQWLGLTRQIFEGSDDPEAEFDDEAVGLCIFIYFKKATDADDEAGDNLWVNAPDQLAARLKEFKQNPYVASLLKSKPTKITAFVSSIG
jgi:hypothetical protein